MKQKIYLIDWNSFIYRMYYWLPEFSTKDWKIVNAVFGMAKFFTNQLKKEKPEYLIFIKDAKWDNFRHKIYSDYKATRDRMPDNLRDQIQDIEDMINMMWVDIIEIDWYEADDVIWTLSKKFCWKNWYEVDILTWDKDLYSLVSDNIKIYDTQKKKKFWPEEAKEKFWVDSKYIIDYLAIVWDISDNIPGIAWFWPKKAIELINTFWSLENIFEALESWKEFPFKWKTLDKLKNSKEIAFLSKKLATIDLSVSLEKFDLENYKFKPEEILNEDIVKLFEDFEFNSLIWEEKRYLKKWDSLSLKTKIIWDDQWLDELLSNISNYKEIVLDTETTSLNFKEAELVWVSIYLDDNNIYYINSMHEWPSVTKSKLREFLKNLLSSDKTIVWHNLKYDLEVINVFLSEQSWVKEKIFNKNLWQKSFNF